MNAEIEQLTYNAIAGISSSKALQHKVPLHAARLEVLEVMKDYDPAQVMGALRALCRAGKIEYGTMVNDFYFKIRYDDGKKQR